MLQRFLPVAIVVALALFLLHTYYLAVGLILGAIGVSLITIVVINRHRGQPFITGRRAAQRETRLVTMGVLASVIALAILFAHKQLSALGDGLIGIGFLVVVLGIIFSMVAGGRR